VRHAWSLTAVLALLACTPANAHAAQRVKLEVSLTPKHLGAGTTIIFGFTIATTAGLAPSPLTEINLLYPANLGITTSGLGLATCSAPVLEALGPEGCPADSRMGYGSALVEVPFGPEIIEETAHSETFMAPVQNGNLGLLFYAEGPAPILAQLVFPGTVQPAPAPYGGQLDTSLPLVPSVPGAPDVAIVRLRSTIGSLHLTYYRHIRGVNVPYHPTGIILPSTCPRHGFPFAAHFRFQNGEHANAHTTVPCPEHTKRNP